MTAVTTEGRFQFGAVPLRVLAVLDVPSPPFTSLTSAARGAYDAARAQWAESERARLVVVPRPAAAGQGN